jgi:hypothetical protein
MSFFGRFLEEQCDLVGTNVHISKAIEAGSRANGTETGVTWSREHTQFSQSDARLHLRPLLTELVNRDGEL